MNFDFTNPAPESDATTTAAIDSYCARCGMEKAVNAGLCSYCTEKARTVEVDELLARNGVEREDVTAEAEIAEPVQISPPPAPTPLSETGERIADNLVPVFGETLQKYEDGSLTLGFPPAVDALITKTGIDSVRAAMVLANFRDAYALADGWRSRATAIVVTDESQTELINEARSLHRIIRDERINVEKRRKELKEPSLREGQLIDGVANVYKDLLAPIEDHLLAQAKFIENREAARRAEAAKVRSEKLALFEIDPKLFPNLGDMTDEAFEVVYSGVREQYHARKEAEKAEERARLERERLAQIENERLRKENERLESERQAEADRAAEQRRIAQEAEAQRKAVQDELDRQEFERLAEEQRVAAEAERKRLAPDREKLADYADQIFLLKDELAGLNVDEKYSRLLGEIDIDLDVAITRIRKAIA